MVWSDCYKLIFQGPVSQIGLKVIAHRVWHFCPKVLHVKNKYLTLCQSRLHTVSETFVRHKNSRFMHSDNKGREYTRQNKNSNDIGLL